MENNLTTRQMLEQAFDNAEQETTQTPVDTDTSIMDAQSTQKEQESTPLTTRQMLEQAFAEMDGNDMITQEETDKETAIEGSLDILSVDELPKLLKGEYADKFGELASDWQMYLLEQEKNIQNQFSKLSSDSLAKKWIDELYESKKEVLASQNISSAKEWIHSLADVEKIMEENPILGLNQIAHAYGLSQVDTHSVFQPLGANSYQENAAGTLMHPALAQQMAVLKNEIQEVNSFLQEQKKQTLHQRLDQILQAKDETGNAKYPYYETVRQEIVDSLKCGRATDIDEAYEKAVWQDKSVREKLIQEKMNKEISQKAKEANRAKTASFSPKGKGTINPNTPSGRPKTTREMLEEAMRDAGF